MREPKPTFHIGFTPVVTFDMIQLNALVDILQYIRIFGMFL